MATYKYSSSAAVLTDLEVGDISDGTGLVWDETNNRLGINEASPDQALHMKGSNAFIKMESSAAAGVEWTMGVEGEDVFFIRDDTGDNMRLVIDASGNVGLGVNDPDERLEVNGAVHLEQVSAPGTTTDKLYNVSGALYWNGTALAGGDITGVTAGDGLSGGGTSGAVTVALDLNELSAAVVAVASDSIVIIDADDNGSKKESIADLVSGMAGSGLSSSSGQLSVDSITSVGAVNSGSITSGFGTINTGSSSITTTGDLSVGDATVTGGDLNFGNGQNATLTVAAVSGTNTAGKSLTVKAGQGTGSGAGGDIVFQTANAGGSGSSANSLATALTLSDDLSGTFGGHVSIPESSSYKIGANAILSDSSGTCTLSNIDALDATTEATIESAIDTLSNLASVGTITTGVWNGTAIGSSYIAADAIDGGKIADDSINSEHLVDGSIDEAHIADNQVSLAKMAGLARGKIIVGDASGDPAALAVGSEDQVLTIDSNGDAVWADASGGGSIDINGLSAAAVDVSADSIAIVDANDSNASRKESIADFVTAIAGSSGSTGLSASSGVLSVSASNTASVMVAGGTLTAADNAGQIIALQVFS